MARLPCLGFYTGTVSNLLGRHLVWHPESLPQNSHLISERSTPTTAPNHCKPSMPIKILGAGIFNVKHRRVECPIYFDPPTQVVWEDLTVDDGCHYYSLHSNDKMLHKHTCFYNICIWLMTSKIIYIYINISKLHCVSPVWLLYTFFCAPCQKKNSCHSLFTKLKYIKSSSGSGASPRLGIWESTNNMVLGDFNPNEKS